MESISDIANKLEKYPQISYDESNDTISYETPEYFITYAEQLITIHYGGEIYEYNVMGGDEGYLFFKWLIKGKLSLSQEGNQLTVKNLNFMRDKKLTKPVGVVGKVIGTIIAAVSIWLGAEFLSITDFEKMFEFQPYCDYVAVWHITFGIALLKNVYKHYPRRWSDFFSIIFGFLLIIILCVKAMVSAVNFVGYPEIHDIIAYAEFIWTEVTCLAGVLLGAVIMSFGFSSPYKDLTFKAKSEK